MLGVRQIAQLNCVYTRVCIKGNKQEEAILQLANCKFTETWWGCSHDWSATVDGCKLFLRDRQGRRIGGMALHVR